MIKLPSEQWRAQREQLVQAKTYGFGLVQEVQNQLEGFRGLMHETLELPLPRPYASTSVDGIRLLIHDLRSLTCELCLRAHGLHAQADEVAEERDNGDTPNTSRH